MQVIENIPPEQINGPRPGRVSILFSANAEHPVIITAWSDNTARVWDPSIHGTPVERLDDPPEIALARLIPIARMQHEHYNTYWLT